MSYTRSQNGQKLVASSLTKAVIYFVDGNSRTFHSRDFARNNSVPSKQLGINRLKKYINDVSPRVEAAIIYDKESDQEISKFKNGTWL